VCQNDEDVLTSFIIQLASWPVGPTSYINEPPQMDQFCGKKKKESEK